MHLVSLAIILCAVAATAVADDRSAAETNAAAEAAASPGLALDPTEHPDDTSADAPDAAPDAATGAPGAASSSPASVAVPVPLPPLEPLMRHTPSEALQDLDRPDPQGDSDAVLPLLVSPEDPGATAPTVEFAPRALELPAAWDPRLHADLPWEFCGPRSGAAGFAGPAAPAGTAGVPVNIVADRVDYDRNTEVIQLRGGVDVVQADQRLSADRSNYDRRSGRLDASGNVFLETPGLRIQGDTADYNVLTRQGTIDAARYRLSGSANLLGTAEEAEILSEQQSRYRNITYTTCPPGNADWSIRARDLKLDQEAGMGYAHHARIRIGKIPVLYTPYIFFPIDDRRRSGFLIPSFGSSDKTGTDISIPYYWNIAPNIDATITPRIMSTRGLMLGTQLRYLDRFQQVEINAEVLPEDRRATELGTRGAVRIEQTGQLGPRWSSAIDFTSVSDDEYLQDFGNRLDTTSLRNLVQRGDVNYFGKGWRALARVQQFQTVDAAIAPANRPYGQLPHIELDLNRRRWNDLVEYDLEGQYDFFDNSARVYGNRLVAVPTLRLPLRRSFGHLIPRARLYYTGYDLLNQAEGLPSRQSYAIPSFDLDGLLVFERDTGWFGTPTLQTLEPRIYYVLTSFEDQSNAPLFDTTELDFSFASLFRPNRFTGYDRIGDENRLTLGLTSRTIANQTGRELFRASLGQIYYFEDRRVQLSADTVEDDIRSSVAGEFAARVTDDWSARASLQWNPNDTEAPWEKRVVQLRYAREEGSRLNLAYRFNDGDDPDLRYEDTDISLQVPIGPQVKLVGRWLYSILNEETVEAFAGIEFGRCCWRLRLLGQHLQTGSDSGSTSLMLQVELAGLGSFGNQIDTLLERGIYGYHSD
ncbi:LPS-assembly protein LptD [Thiocapsa marina]|uniref:LPS-assembly protein LptD n=1 Tax=Thiocapsa marina 5811 TaxID=768671 RepID=F9U6H1_9GAMM|nr:LPS-assembly protein LptD [Thiocapsa marina]EGV19847.1 LPS-assembly protein lptD [Thiocapsa marina 5811]